MDPRIFAAEPMGLREQMLSMPLEQRFTYDEATNHFFVDLERFALRNEADIEHIQKIVKVASRLWENASMPSSITTISRSIRRCLTLIQPWFAV